MSGDVDRLLGELGLGELKRLLALIRKEYEPLFAGRKTICLVGPVNTGKSSLYNALIGPLAPKAEVSPVPGTTRVALRGDAEAFWIVDTPGANEAAVGAEDPGAGAERRARALEAASAADFLVIVFDAARGVAQDEVRIYEELMGLRKPGVVVLNKIDLVGRSEQVVVQAAAQSLQLRPDEIIPTSATRRINLNLLLLAIVKADPQLLATLSELVPASRWVLARSVILKAAVAAGTANLLTAPVPVPFASFLPITAIQIAMVLNLARTFGFPLNPGRAKEIVAAVGTGFLGRTLFYQLIRVVPVAGAVLGTAIAAAVTMALGYSLATWFAYGERPSRDAVGKLARRLTQVLIEQLKRFPDRKSLKKGLAPSVEDTLAQIDRMMGE